MKNVLSLSLAATVLLCASSVRAQSSRVEQLLGQLTLDEKLSFLSGSRDPRNLGQAGYLPGVPRLGIPELRLTDGPAGIRVARPATALPAPVALAATFSPLYAQRYGTILGQEGRALEQDILLSPMTNIVRVPGGGRNFETLGEDPLLAAQLVAAEIRAIQREGLIATVKHFAANNFERDRMSVDVQVEEQALRELYLPAFEAAVQAGAGSVMGSYNKLNGTFACENPFLLTTVLRDEWGFSGFVMSDWFATHSTTPALAAGLDLEMPGSGMGSFGPPSFYGAALKKALTDGTVPQASVDRAVRRILTSLDKVGLLGATRRRPSLESIAPDDARIAQDIAIAGSVLLRNERQTLPLSKSELGSLVLIGPPAQVPIIGGGGSAAVAPLQKESLLTALARRTGAAPRFVLGIDLDGIPVPATALRLKGATSLNFVGKQGLKPGKYTWEGTLTAPTSGSYALKLQARRGTAQLVLDGKPLLSVGHFFGGNDSLLPTREGLKNGTVVVTLSAGVAHKLLVTAEAGGGPPGMPAPKENLELRLAWVTPQLRAQRLAEAVAAAKRAKTAVVCAYDEGTEGKDRESLALPGDQDALIAAVAAANPRTIVVLSTGSCVTMPWLAKTAAVLETWYPGQAGAEATAALLCGEAEPGGRLPITFPQRADDSPTARVDRYPGVGGKASYSEGIFVGYRHYDAQKLTPLFPFGHGLSYTQFQLSDLNVTPVKDDLLVSVRVKNTGKRTGVAVPQVYLGPAASCPAPQAVRKLIAFQHATVTPGTSILLVFRIQPRELAYWSVEKHAWVVPSGPRSVWVGFSSRDLKLEAKTP